jgi:hypothetical protein
LSRIGSRFHVEGGLLELSFFIFTPRINEKRSKNNVFSSKTLGNMEEMYYLCGMIEEQILTELKSGSQHCKMGL